MIVTKQPENLTAAFGLSYLLDTNGRTIVTVNWRREGRGGGGEGGRERDRERDRQTDREKERGGDRDNNTWCDKLMLEQKQSSVTYPPILDSPTPPGHALIKSGSA